MVCMCGAEELECDIFRGLRICVRSVGYHVWGKCATRLVVGYVTAAQKWNMGNGLLEGLWGDRSWVEWSRGLGDPVVLRCCAGSKCGAVAEKAKVTLPGTEGADAEGSLGPARCCCAGLRLIDPGQRSQWSGMMGVIVATTTGRVQAPHSRTSICGREDLITEGGFV